MIVFVYDLLCHATDRSNPPLLASAGLEDSVHKHCGHSKGKSGLLIAIYASTAIKP